MKAIVGELPAPSGQPEMCSVWSGCAFHVSVYTRESICAQRAKRARDGHSIMLLRPLVRSAPKPLCYGDTVITLGVIEV
jgi:hypothetical protein